MQVNMAQVKNVTLAPPTYKCGTTVKDVGKFTKRTGALNSGKNIRDSKWTQSIAVGSENFIDNIKEDLVISAKGRKVSGTKDIFQLRETSAP